MCKPRQVMLINSTPIICPSNFLFVFKGWSAGFPGLGCLCFGTSCIKSWLVSYVICWIDSFSPTCKSFNTIINILFSSWSKPIFHIKDFIAWHVNNCGIFNNYLKLYWTLWEKISSLETSPPLLPRMSLLTMPISDILSSL